MEFRIIFRFDRRLSDHKVAPSQAGQILANLCVNARDCIKSVGKVTIETRNVTCDAQYCRQRHGISPGNYVMATVSDTGCGMTKETQDHISEPSFTTKDSGKGTALGLATVYGIMKHES